MAGRAGPAASPRDRQPDSATAFIHDMWYDLMGRLNGWEDSHSQFMEEVRGMVSDASKEQRSLAEASGRRQDELTQQLGDVARDIARHHAVVSEFLLRRLAHEDPRGGSSRPDVTGLGRAQQQEQDERTICATTTAETASQTTMTSARLGAGALGGGGVAAREAASQAAMTSTRLQAHGGDGAASKRESVSQPSLAPAAQGKSAKSGAGVTRVGSCRMRGAEHRDVERATSDPCDQQGPKLRRSSIVDSLDGGEIAPPCAAQSFSKTVLPMAETCYAAYMSIKEPERAGFLADLERKSSSFFALVIFVNVCWMTWFVNQQAANPDDAVAWRFPVENVFLAIYLAELGLRVAVHRLYFFCNDDAGWNWLDFLIVFIDTLETTLAEETSRGFGFVRVLRALKFTRVFRLFRLVHFLKELRLIWDCLIGSFRSLFWSIVMMMLIVYMFSLVLVQGATAYLAEDDDADSSALGPNFQGRDSREVLVDKFGSMSSSILSLYAAITGGNDWMEMYNAISPAGDSYSYLFLFFIAFCQISLLNILTGIFVENALELAQPTREQVALEKHNEEVALTMDLHRLISAFDSVGSGHITVETFFAEVVGSPLHVFLHTIDVSVRELKAFVEFTGADKRGTISVSSLVHGCTLARGNARNLDMQRVLLDVSRMRREQAAMFRALKSASAGMALEENRSSTDSHPGTPRSSLSEDD